MFGRSSRRQWFQGLFGALLGALGVGARSAQSPTAPVSPGKEVFPPHTTTSYECAPAWHVVTWQGPVSSTAYDGAGRLLSHVELGGNVTSCVYDNAGKVGVPPAPGIEGERPPSA
jgi:YD repeat-containing protein